jgi:Helix-turn-helix domain
VPGLRAHILPRRRRVVRRRAHRRHLPGQLQAPVGAHVGRPPGRVLTDAGLVQRRRVDHGRTVPAAVAHRVHVLPVPRPGKTGNAVSSDHGASVNDWVNVVRRARLHATTKLIALLLASYANPDGTRIYPGVARLAIQSGHGYRTVQRELARLRAMGLIERMPRIGVRRGWSAPYRLVLGDDVMEKAGVPTPAAEDMAVEKLAIRYRGRHRKAKSARHADGVQTSDCTPPDDTTARHGQLADQEKAHRTLHVPLPGINPPSDETDHRNGGTGRRTPRADDEISEQVDPRTREGTDLIRRRMAAELDAWIRDHPEHEPPPLTNSAQTERWSHLLAPGIGACNGTAADMRQTAAAIEAAES